MSLTEEIEAELNRLLDKLGEGLSVKPGPERGLAWGENGEGRIVVPLDVVAKFAASVAERSQRRQPGPDGDRERDLRDQWLEGFAQGIQEKRP